MRINITHIMKATNCNEEQALNVERYIDQGDMLDWSEASLSMINTIARAVHDNLLRNVPRKKVAKVKIAVTKTPKATPSAPAKGTKIAHALVIYNEMQVDGVRCSRQDIISAMANSMQIEKKAAAGYYQSCKKKVGA